MTEILQDPCLEIEETSEETEQGSSVLPVGQRRQEAPREAFPTRLPERIEQDTLRESSILNQPFLASEHELSSIRFPNQAYSIQEWSRLPRNTIDTFRYISGKYFLYSTDTDLQFINSGELADVTVGVPYRFNYVESTVIARREMSHIELIFDKPSTEQVAVNSQLFELSEDVNEFIFYYTNPELFPGNESSAPFLPFDQDFEDIFFTAPAAFFESEVEQSILSIIETVSVTPVVGDLPIEEGGNETSKQSLYRLYANSNIDSEIPKRFSNDILQKYGSNQIEQINEININATSPVVNSQFYSEAKKPLNTHMKISLRFSTFSPVFARALKNYSFDTIFLDFLSTKSSEISNAPKFVQVLDQSVLGGELNNRLVYNYEPKIYDAEAFLNSLYQNINTTAEFLLSSRNHHPLLYENSNETDLRNLLNDNFYDRSYERYIRESTRNFLRPVQDIFLGKTAKSEVLAFRIEKVDTETNEVIQNFYIFNDPDTEYLDFLDTQVVYKKRYTYRIYAINYVIGNRYSYKQKENTATLQQIRESESPKFKFAVENFYKIYFVETPFFEQNTVMLDKPPLFPEYDIVPFAGSNRKIAFRLTPSYGKIKEKPIQILNSDISVIQNMILAQDEFSEEIEYVGDTLPTKYQVLFMKEPPINYQSFSTAESVIVDSNDNSGYIELNLDPNVKYYLVFRAIDNAGISNPSLVYCLRLNSYVDGTYVEFEEYDLTSQILDQPIVFDNVLKIEPSSNQMSINFQGVENEAFYLKAPHIEDLDLGLDDQEKLWMKRYKFRLISRHTNKAIDINVRFKYEKIIPIRNLLIPLEIQDLDIDIDISGLTNDVPIESGASFSGIASANPIFPDSLMDNISAASQEVLQEAQQSEAVPGGPPPGSSGNTQSSGGTGGTGGY